MKKLIFITGSTDGIGKQTALELVRQGNFVVLHGRSEAKCLATIEEIGHKVPEASLEYVTGNLSSMKSVRMVAETVMKKYDRLDVLLNNAGTFMNQKMTTSEGFETTFAVNHLAPFLLTHELLPLLKKTPSSRIVTVSSIAHRNGTIDLTNLNGERSFSGYSAYASSKLMNILFTFELAERLQGTSITANCLHPGVVGTKLLKTGFNGMSGSDSLETGAETSVFLSTSPEVEQITGQYFMRKKAAPVSPIANDNALRKKFWEISEECCRGTLNN